MKPRIFKPIINHRVNNNTNVYYSNKEEKDMEEVSLSVLLKDPYFFVRNVLIYTNDGVYDTKIAGKMGNNIITLDSKSIPIDKIIKIIKK